MRARSSMYTLASLSSWSSRRAASRTWVLCSRAIRLISASCRESALCHPIKATASDPMIARTAPIRVPLTVSLMRLAGIRACGPAGVKLRAFGSHPPRLGAPVLGWRRHRAPEPPRASRGPEFGSRRRSAILGSANGEPAAEPPRRKGRRLPTTLIAERSSATGVPWGAARGRQLRGSAYSPSSPPDLRADENSRSARAAHVRVDAQADP
jgi:hypothetical protein